MTQKPCFETPRQRRSGTVPDHPVARGRAGAVRGCAVSARGAGRDAIACGSARQRAGRGRGGADRRAAVRPLQCRRFCGAIRRCRHGQRSHAGAAGAERGDHRLRHRADAAGVVRYGNIDRNRRAGAARGRCDRDGRAYPAHRAIARSTSAAPLRPGNSSPMPAPTSRAARRCCAVAPSSARARSACSRPAASPKFRSRAGRASPCSRPAMSWCSRAQPLRPAAIYDTNGAIVAAAIERERRRGGVSRRRCRR